MSVFFQIIVHWIPTMVFFDNKAHIRVVFRKLIIVDRRTWPSKLLHPIQTYIYGLFKYVKLNH